MAKLIDIVVPTEQREGTRSSIGRWLKKVGEAVTKDEPLLEIHTDKVTLEVAAPASGILKEILKQKDAEIELTELLGRIEVTAGTQTESPKLSPAVRTFSAERGVDPSDVKGSGKGGRVTANDIDRVAPPIATKRVPHTPMRRSIAEHMVQSVTVAPHVTTAFEADLSAMFAHKGSEAADFEKRNVKLTYTAYFIKAAARALRQVPEANSRWHDEYLEILEEINIGIATALESAQGGGAGLVVPVMRNADTLSLFDIASKLQDLTAKARTGKLTGPEVHGATFTISNHGVGGSLFAAPIIIPQPQSAILGIGKIEQRVIVEKIEGRDQFVSRPSAYFTLTIDHRVLDGFTANKFLSEFVREVSNP